MVFPIIPSFPAAVLSFFGGAIIISPSSHTGSSKIPNLQSRSLSVEQISSPCLSICSLVKWHPPITPILPKNRATTLFKSNWSAEIGRAIELCHQIIELCHQIPPNGWLENDFANPNDRFQNSILDLPLLPASETWPDPPQALEWPLPLWRSAQILGGVSWGPALLSRRNLDHEIRPQRKWRGVIV